VALGWLLTGQGRSSHLLPGPTIAFRHNAGGGHKAKDHGYPHELWTRRLLARHARENASAAGHECLAKLVQGTVCKILGQEEIKPHKARYYLERRDVEFEQKMAEVLCVYREVQVLKKAARSQKPRQPVAIVSYDEKPARIQVANA
jgi:hypothetical protein